MAGRTAPRLGSTIAHWRRRAGVYLDRSRRSVWFHGDGIDDFEAVEGLIRRLRRRVTTDRFVYTSPRSETCEWLRRKYPNDNALPVPFDVGTLFRRFFTQLNPR
ncbi:MAG: glycosyltransferase N-terminal domain-containing protein, partial [Candidatus Binatia bacterium]